MIYIYRFVQILLLPLAFLYVIVRLLKRKEDIKRFAERLGYSSKERDFSKKLIWFNCASVGESLSVQYIINKLVKQKNIQILVTTGTVTSAKIMGKKLPAGVVHQYIPIDYCSCVKRFMKYWKPDLSVFVDSDLWPNLVHYANNPILINASMSDKSYAKYTKNSWFLKAILQKFEIIFAKSSQDESRFKRFTDIAIVNAGNIKYDGPAPACDVHLLNKFKEKLQNKKVMVVASTHPGEEEQLVQVFKDLKTLYKDLFLIIAPRHPHRGNSVAEVFQKNGLSFSQRSKGDFIQNDDSVYIADTIGEMALWYNLASFVVIGGSLVPHGGQSPLETLKIGKPVITGPYMNNFKNMTDLLESKQVLYKANSSIDIYNKSLEYLKNPKELTKFASLAKSAIKDLTGASDTVIDYIIKRLGE